VARSQGCDATEAIGHRGKKSELSAKNLQNVHVREFHALGFK